MRGLLKLTWLEIKIFIREPLGVVGSVAIPILVFVVLARLFGPAVRGGSPGVPRFASADLPVFAALMIAASAGLSLITIIAIYREGGILKRLRATPLRPTTILTAHVIVKLLFTAFTLAVMIAAGARYYPIAPGVPLVSFTIALLFSTVSLLSIGFLVASLVPTARFAQPVASLVLYPMLGVSGLFAPVESFPRWLEVVAHALPFTHAVALLRGVWHGEGWLAHVPSVIALVLTFLVCTVAASKVFRWE